MVKVAVEQETVTVGDGDDQQQSPRDGDEASWFNEQRQKDVGSTRRRKSREGNSSSAALATTGGEAPPSIGRPVVELNRSRSAQMRLKVRPRGGSVPPPSLLF